MCSETRSTFTCAYRLSLVAVQRLPTNALRIKPSKPNRVLTARALDLAFQSRQHASKSQIKRGFEPIEQ